MEAMQTDLLPCQQVGRRLRTRRAARERVVARRQVTPGVQEQLRLAPSILLAKQSLPWVLGLNLELGGCDFTAWAWSEQPEVNDLCDTIFAGSSCPAAVRARSREVQQQAQKRLAATLDHHAQSAPGLGLVSLTGSHGHGKPLKCRVSIRTNSSSTV